MAGVPAGGNTLKNILIGIGTTVAAYAIISLLGIGKSKNSEAKIQKKANMEVWESVNDYFTYATEKFRTIACYSCDEQEMKKELVRELENNANSLKTLKENKSIDDKMQSLIDRAIQQINDLKPVYIEYFDSLTFVRSLPVPEQLPQSVRIQTKYIDKIIYIQNRDTTELQNYLRDINRKHKTELALKEASLDFKPKLLPRKWKIECAFFIDLKKDGSVEWTEGETVFKGKWKLDEDDQILNIKLETNQEFNYPIRLLNEKMMVYYNKDSKALMAGCPQ